MSLLLIAPSSSPALKLHFILFFFCLLIHRTFFSFWKFSVSQLHLLSPLKCQLHCSPLLRLCLFAFSVVSPHLNEPDGRMCAAVWSRGSWAWLNCSQIAAPLRRLRYSSSAAPHCVWDTHTHGTYTECVGEEGECVRQEWVCACSCAHINQTCCRWQYQLWVNRV